MKRVLLVLMLLSVGVAVSFSAAPGDAMPASPPDNKSWTWPVFFNLRASAGDAIETMSPREFTVMYRPEWVSSGEANRIYVVIHNARPTSVAYSVRFEVPGSLKDGYSAPPADAANWVSISSPNPTLEPGTTLPIAVTLIIPSDAVTPKAWEFDVSVSAQGQGYIVSQTATRFLVKGR